MGFRFFSRLLKGSRGFTGCRGRKGFCRVLLKSLRGVTPRVAINPEFDNGLFRV